MPKKKKHSWDRDRNRNFEASGSTPSVQKGQGLYTDAPPLPQTLPLDPIYTSDQGAINLNYENTIGRIGFDTTALGQEYGYQPTLLPDGTPNPQAGQLDPSNPYSVAANLQRRYQQGQRGTTNSYAERGLGYSSAHQNVLDEGTYQYNRSEDQARRSFQRADQDLIGRRQDAGFNQTIGLNTAASDRLGRLDPSQTVPQATTVPRTGPINVPKNTPSLYRRRRKNR